MPHQAMLSFNSGEVNPYLRHRIDFEKTSSSAELMENFLAMPYGGVIKRPGLEFLATTLAAGKNSRLLKFIAADGSKYFLHFTVNTLTIYRPAGTVAATLAFLSGYSWPGTFSWDNSLRDLQLVQINDVAFLTHQKIHPLRLSRTSDTAWVLEFVPFTAAPMLDENLDDDVEVMISADPRPANWSNSGSYGVDGTVYWRDAEWVCLIAHTVGLGGATQAITEPGVGLGWNFFWRQRMLARGEAVRVRVRGVGYVVGKRYLAGDKTYTSGGNSYVCISAHDGADDKHPVSGFYASTYWTQGPNLVPSFSVSSRSPGNYWSARIQRDTSDFEVKVQMIRSTTDNATRGIAVNGAWDLFTEGAWAGTLEVQKSVDNGVTWTTLRTFTARLDRALAVSGEEAEACFLRLYFVQESSDPSITPASGNLWATLAPQAAEVAGQILITDYVDPNEMTGIASTPLLCGVTPRWSKGAFSEGNGFPRAIVLHESRLGYAGTVANPVSLWLSASDDLLNFQTGAAATAGIFVSLATGNHDPIRWMSSQRRLFLGLAEGEWVAGSETSDAALSPTNFVVRKYSGYGSLAGQPVIVNDSVLFLERKGTRLREMVYSLDRGGYDATDLSRLGSHLLLAGISNMDWQQTREPGLWAVTRDGLLLHLAYNKPERLAAWSRHTTQTGVFRDVAVLASNAGDDEVFFIVDRTVGGVTTSCLERFRAGWQEAVESAADGLGFLHLDGVAGSASVATIPHHLCNQALTLVSLLNSTPSGIPTVSTTTAVDLLGGGGSLALGASKDWQFGYLVVSRLDSLPIDVLAATGITQARKKRGHKLLVSLFRSRGGYLWLRNLAAKQAIPNTQPALVLRTGWEETIPDAGALDDLQLRVYHEDPFPFCLRSAVVRWNLNEP